MGAGFLRYSRDITLAPAVDGKRRDQGTRPVSSSNQSIPPVSAIREKVLAAQRAGVTVVAFPKANEVDIVNLEDQVKAGLEIVLADAIEPLVDLVLLKK